MGDWANLATDSTVFCAILAVLQIIFFAYCSSVKLTYAESDLNATFYAMFIDVSIMIFFGFGFLMTFLRRHGYSAVGLCVITSAAVVQLSLVVEGLLKDQLEDFGGDFCLNTLINGLFCAGAVMISMGAVLGKVSPSQLLLMGVIETVLYFVNFFLYTKTIGAHDAAGGVCLHAFGAYFGLVVAKCLTTPAHLDHKDNSPIYSSDLFSLTGTLFLWLLWPSFCGAVAPTNELKFICVTNTFIGLIGSVMGYALLSRWMHHGKFDMVEMQNSTLAGGVAMGVGADLFLQPAGALGLGLLAGLLSVFGYAKVNLGTVGLSDTCGVHNLHGMPGLLGAVYVIIFTLVEKPEGLAAQTQLLGMCVTLLIATVGGLVTGMLLKALPGVGDVESFNDSPYWEVADDYKLN